MEKRTEGAWLVHHTKKLFDTESFEFEDVELAGKCGLLLSSLTASEEQSELNSEQVHTIARFSNIKKTEIDTILKTLAKEHLIDIAKNGSVSVLGITTSSVLIHTSEIFHTTNPNSLQKASVELAEKVSDAPQTDLELKEYISDLYRLEQNKLDTLFKQSEEIGLIDYEQKDDEKILFNGNLFRRENIFKTEKVLTSLSSDDTEKVIELNQLLDSYGCIQIEIAKRVLGDKLLDKLHSIGMYDFNEVSNPTHAKIFLTKPSAFSKYGNPFEEDALDLAKAFIASLYYGMSISTSDRGRIRSRQMLYNTLRKLLRGEEVGPCTAIGQDYLILEQRRVIKLTESNYRGQYYMRLLKMDIGNLAYELFRRGDITEQVSFDALKSSNVIQYSGPEFNRMRTRRKKGATTSTKNVIEQLRTLRQ